MVVSVAVCVVSEGEGHMDLIWIFRWTGRRAQVGTDPKSRV